MSVSRIFIVNVWHTRAEPPGFRASVRAVEDLEPRFFTAADELARHFAEAVAALEPDRRAPAAASDSSSSAQPPRSRS